MCTHLRSLSGVWWTLPLPFIVAMHTLWTISLLSFVTCCTRVPPCDDLNVANMWKGVVERTNQVGYFDRANTAPYIEIPSIDTSLLRNRSKTVRPGQCWRISVTVIPLRSKLSGTVYCNRSCLFVCVFVCLWICYHNNSKLCASIFTKLGL